MPPPEGTSAAAVLEALGRVLEDARQRRERALRIRLRFKRAWLTCVVLGMTALAVCSALVLFGVVHVNVLHVKL